MANYAGTADADCSTIYGHWYGRRPGNKCNSRCWSYQYSKLADWKYDSAISIGFLAYISQSIGAGKKEQAKKLQVQAVLTVVIVGIFFTISDNGTEPVKSLFGLQVDPSIQKLASSYFLILYAPMLFRTVNIIFGTVLRAVGDTKTPMQVGVAF